jgi:hypothetical protein
MFPFPFPAFVRERRMSDEAVVPEMGTRHDSLAAYLQLAGAGLPGKAIRNPVQQIILCPFRYSEMVRIGVMAVGHGHRKNAHENYDDGQ